MTTLTIEIPDSGRSILKDITSLVESVEGNIRFNSDENRVELKNALHDAFDIIEGKTPRRTIRDVLNG